MLANEISKKTSNLTSAAASKAEKIKKFAKNKVDKIEKKGRNMNKDIENNAYKLGEKARNALDKTETWVEDSIDYVKNKAQKKPFLTIGVTLLIGMLLGKFGSSK